MNDVAQLIIFVTNCALNQSSNDNDDDDEVIKDDGPSRREHIWPLGIDTF